MPVTVGYLLQARNLVARFGPAWRTRPACTRADRAGGNRGGSVIRAVQCRMGLPSGSAFPPVPTEAALKKRYMPSAANTSTT